MIYKLLDGEAYSYRLQCGISGYRETATIGTSTMTHYAVTLKTNPDDVAEYVRSRVKGLKDFEWWWTAKNGKIEVCIKEAAVLRIAGYTKRKVFHWVKTLRPHAHFPHIQIIAWMLVEKN